MKATSSLSGCGGWPLAGSGERVLVQLVPFHFSSPFFETEGAHSEPVQNDSPPGESWPNAGARPGD